LEIADRDHHPRLAAERQPDRGARLVRDRHGLVDDEVDVVGAQLGAAARADEIADGHAGGSQRTRDRLAEELGSIWEGNGAHLARPIQLVRERQLDPVEDHRIGERYWTKSETRSGTARERRELGCVEPYAGHADASHETPALEDGDTSGVDRGGVTVEEIGLARRDPHAAAASICAVARLPVDRGGWRDRLARIELRVVVAAAVREVDSVQRRVQRVRDARREMNPADEPD